MKKSKKKTVLICVIAVVLALAIAAGCWFFFGRQGAEAVNVYPFHYFGMTEYWGDSQESYGPVSTDKIQTVFLSATQTVTEVLVSQGDSVKKGDLLMTFDTTLDDIALERERLKVEKLKLDLDDAEDRLVEIKNMKPMVIPSQPEEDPEEENLGVALTDPYRISQQSVYDGTSQDKALICWLRGDASIDDALFRAIHAAADAHRAKNAESTLPSEPTTPEDPTTPEEPTAPEDSTTPEEPTAPEDSTTPVTPEGSSPDASGSETETTEPTDPPADGTNPTDPTEPSQPEPPADPNHYYVVLKITQDNMSLGHVNTWQGLSVKRDENGNYSFRFYDAYGFTDHTLAIPEAPKDDNEIDYGSGYTSAQIAELRSQQEKAIRDLRFQVLMAEADYKIKLTEVSDGNVYAEIDGTVVSLLTPEEAQLSQQPFMKVSGGGGFYVTGSISELEKDNLQMGQEVTINDWNTGMTYVGTVESLGDYPAADGSWNGMGNPNATYYPFTVFVDESADLQAGSYVSVMLSGGSVETGVYLENPFLRTEQGKTYVYVRAADGTLEKRYVTTGKSLWGSYTQILEGLTAEDYLAFPYGKNIKEGAATVEADPSALYES